MFSRGELEFERGHDILVEVEKFCYLGDVIICYGRASGAVRGRIGSTQEKFMEFEATWGDLPALC